MFSKCVWKYCMIGVSTHLGIILLDLLSLAFWHLIFCCLAFAWPLPFHKLQGLDKSLLCKPFLQRRGGAKCKSSQEPALQLGPAVRSQSVDGVLVAQEQSRRRQCHRHDPLHPSAQLCVFWDKQEAKREGARVGMSPTATLLCLLPVLSML